MFHLYLQGVSLCSFESLVANIVFVIVRLHFSFTENLVPCSERHSSKESAGAE